MGVVRDCCVVKRLALHAMLLALVLVLLAALSGGTPFESSHFLNFPEREPLQLHAALDQVHFFKVPKE